MRQASAVPRTGSALLATGLASLLALAGCKLIDQTTFAPAPATGPNFVPTPPVLETRKPLLTIGATTTLPDYRAVLRYGVQQAQLRDPTVRFDVVSVVPDTGTPAEQVKTAEKTQSLALSVMRDLITDGVADQRIRLSARSSPRETQPRVEIYVR